MAQSDLMMGIKHLNSYGRLLWSVILVVHACIMYSSPYLLLLLVGGYAAMTYGIYRVCYVSNFRCDPRYEREDAACPSNSRRPGFEASIDTRNAEMLSERRQSLKHLTLNESTGSALLTPAEEEHKRRANPRLTLNIDNNDTHIRLQDREGTLDMNHVEMSWVQFLTAYLLIVPSALMLQLKGLPRMSLRKWLHRHGIVQPRPIDYEVEVGRLCLETMQSIHFTGFKDETVAIFAWSEFPVVLNEDVENGEIHHADLFVIDVDVSTKRFVKAMLDDRELTAAEVYILLNFSIVSHTHPKIHAIAPWGLHTSNPHPFVRWMSVVTVMYNYFGFTTFTQISAGWRALGLVKYNYDVTKTCFANGIEEGIPPHENIRELVPHSSLVKFLAGTRNIFLNEFQDYKDEFMGIDGEAFFASTIIHSLDHSTYTTYITDVLHLDDDHPDFGFMAECAQMTFEGFTKDLPLLPFNRRFRNAPHPFYKAVYDSARQLNPWFADRMDACIIK